MKQLFSLVMASIIIYALTISPMAFATETTGAPSVEWVKGPGTVSVDGMAELTFNEKYVYLGKEDTVKMMEYFGNPTSEIEMGSIFPADENQGWFVIFEYHDSGHVDDKDKNDIKPDALLKSLKEGTEEGNKVRKERGMPELHIEGWAEPPAYNEALHSLAWGTIYSSEGGKGINYECKILSREGYVTATLVCSEEEFLQCKAEFIEIVNNFKFIEGKRYSDYIPGTDKLSDLGLAALVLGGTAAAAKKGGLLFLLIAFLKKGWILVAGALGFAGKKFGKKGEVPIEDLPRLDDLPSDGLQTIESEHSSSSETHDDGSPSDTSTDKIG